MTFEDRSLTSKRSDDYQRDPQPRAALQVTKFHHRHRLLNLHFSAGLVPKASTRKSVQSTVVGTAQAEQVARTAGLNHSSGMSAETLLPMNSNEEKIWFSVSPSGFQCFHTSFF